MDAYHIHKLFQEACAIRFQISRKIECHCPDVDVIANHAFEWAIKDMGIDKNRFLAFASLRVGDHLLQVIGTGRATCLVLGVKDTKGTPCVPFRQEQVDTEIYLVQKPNLNGRLLFHEYAPGQLLPQPLSYEGFEQSCHGPRNAACFAYQPKWQIGNERSSTGGIQIVEKPQRHLSLQGRFSRQESKNNGSIKAYGRRKIRARPGNAPLQYFYE